MNPVNWISNPKIAIIFIALVGVWSVIGYNMVLFLAGLQEIPRDYYEAATIDGAGRVKQFFSITLPLISPTMFFVTVTRIIAALQVFDVIYMMIDKSNDGKITHERSHEYASYIMEAIVTGNPYKIGGNVLNKGLIDNLPSDACVEVPCLVDNMGIHPTHVGKLPIQLAAMNINNINAQLLAIEAAVTKDRQKIYQAAMMDPHTAAELSIEDIISMCDEMIEAHGEFMKEYK